MIWASVSKIELQKLLTQQLHLNRPVFRLERIGSKLAGSVISPTFSRKSDRQRQRMILNALRAAVGNDAVREVGTLLAYTPAEWNVDLMDNPTAKAG